MKKIIASVVLFSIVVLSGFGCKDTRNQYTVNLEVWGTFDNTGAFDDVFNAYRAANKNVENLQYKKMALESYKQDLLSGLAAGNGPDAFMIHNSWLPDFMDKVVPVPPTMINEQEFRANFVDVAADDMIVDGQIYGVPMFVDSLGLYYNKSIFNAAGITRPPRTWEEFDKAVKALTVVDEYGNITQSGATIGTAYNSNGSVNVNKAPDILTVLMMQNGAEMSNRVNGTIEFGGTATQKSGAKNPAMDALKYYTDFASFTSPQYTWNKSQNYSIDEFFEGTAAMTLNYSYHYDTIKAKNAKLNFAVADLPQKNLDTSGTQANFADYWVLVVAKNKKPTQSTQNNAVVITDDMRIYETWQLLKSLTFPTGNGLILKGFYSDTPLLYPVEFDLTEKYLEVTGKPAARRDIVEKQKTDVRLGAFARGNLIARTWWRKDADAVDALFYDMIDRVNIGQMSVAESVNLGASRAQQLQ